MNEPMDLMELGSEACQALQAKVPRELQEDPVAGVLTGGVLIGLALTRGRLLGTTLAAIGGGLIHRALAQQLESSGDAGERRQRSASSSATLGLSGSPGAHSQDGAPESRAGRSQQPVAEPSAPDAGGNSVDEASWESFPASDPPANY